MKIIRNWWPSLVWQAISQLSRKELQSFFTGSCVMRSTSLANWPQESSVESLTRKWKMRLINHWMAWFTRPPSTKASRTGRSFIRRSIFSPMLSCITRLDWTMFHQCLSFLCLNNVWNCFIFLILFLFFILLCKLVWNGSWFLFILEFIMFLCINVFESLLLINDWVILKNIFLIYFFDRVVWVVVIKKKFQIINLASSCLYIHIFKSLLLDNDFWFWKNWISFKFFCNDETNSLII